MTAEDIKSYIQNNLGVKWSVTLLQNRFDLYITCEFLEDYFTWQISCINIQKVDHDWLDVELELVNNLHKMYNGHAALAEKD